MRRVLLLGVLLALLAPAFGCSQERGWSWPRADLDRNRLNLAFFRGADSGPELAEWIQNGEVVGTSRPSRGPDVADPVVIVRYEREKPTLLAGATTEIEAECYRFAVSDETLFERVDCPSWPQSPPPFSA